MSSELPGAMLPENESSQSKAKPRDWEKLSPDDNGFAPRSSHTGKQLLLDFSAMCQLILSLAEICLCAAFSHLATKRVIPSTYGSFQ